MRDFRRYIGQWLSALLVLLLTACSSGNDDSQPDSKPVLKIFDTDDYLNPCYSYAIPASSKKEVIDLTAMTTEDGKKIDPSHVYMVGFSTDASNSLYIEDVYLSDDGENPATGIESLLTPQSDAEVIYYDLQGRPVENPTTGIYIRSTDQKKVYIQ